MSRASTITEREPPPATAPERGRRWLEAALVLGLFAVALRLLAGEVAHLRYHDIAAAVAEVPRQSIVLAVLATIAAYAVFPGYDLLALRYAGHRLPVRRTAYGSIITYGISHTLGLPAFTGGALRLRLWSAWGLSTMEIARAVTFAGSTFAFGVLTLVGAVGLFEPSASLARLHLPVVPVRVLALACLAVSVAYVGISLIAAGREVRVGRFAIPIPRPPLVGAQLLVAATDWVLSALVLYVLLPAGHGVHFPGFVAAFLLAQVGGILSHVPGGLGVFETLIFLQVGGSVPAERLVAALLVYRVVFYLLPFGAALVMLAVHEVRQQQSGLGRMAGAVAVGFERWAEPLVPTALGLMTMAGGALLLISGATPELRGRLSVLVDLLPLGVVELSHFAGSVVGAALLVLGWALTRRLDAAWQLTRALLVVAIVASLLKGLDWEEGLSLAVVLLMISVSRDAFYRKASLLAEPLTPAWVAAIVAILGVSIWVGLFSYKHEEFTAQLWWRFAARGDAPRFLRASAGAAGLLVLLGMLRLLRHARAHPALPTAELLSRVSAIVAQTESTAAALALLGDKSIIIGQDGDGFLMYGVAGRSWIAMGDPVGPDPARHDLAWRFVEAADEHGAWPVFYEVSSRHLPLYIDLGLTLLKVGEEAIVPLGAFSLDGAARKGLRRTRRDVEKAGAAFAMVDRADVPPILPVLREISDEWLASKATREKSFSLGRFDEQYLAHFSHAVIRVNERIVAFANVWTGNGRELSIDLMRYRRDAPQGVMEYLCVALMLWGAERGFERMSLGMAPLSGLEVGALTPLWNRVGGLLYRHGENFYNFQGLRRYKEKFDPVWEPRYLATPAGLALPRILANLGALISGGITGLFTR
jgi:phosphatidylglycerol lysyltransferase